MRIRPLDPSWLIHDIEYEERIGEDEYQNPRYAPKEKIESVRVDFSKVYSRTMDGVQVVAEGVIFVDSTHSFPFPDFKEASKIHFEGGVLHLKKVVPVYNPKVNAIHHYELEVV